MLRSEPCNSNFQLHLWRRRQPAGRPEGEPGPLRQLLPRQPELRPLARRAVRPPGRRRHPGVRRQRGAPAGRQLAQGRQGAGPRPTRHEVHQDRVGQPHHKVSSLGTRLAVS